MMMLRIFTNTSLLVCNAHTLADCVCESFLQEIFFFYEIFFHEGSHCSNGASLLSMIQQWSWHDRLYYWREGTPSGTFTTPRSALVRGSGRREEEEEKVEKEGTRDALEPLEAHLIIQLFQRSCKYFVSWCSYNQKP